MEFKTKIICKPSTYTEAYLTNIEYLDKYTMDITK